MGATEQLGGVRSLGTVKVLDLDRYVVIWTVHKVAMFATKFTSLSARHSAKVFQYLMSYEL